MAIHPTAVEDRGQAPPAGGEPEHGGRHEQPGCDRLSRRDHRSEVAQTLIRAAKGALDELDDLVVALRKDDGKIKLKQSFSPAGTGAAGGALWGGLIGLIFLMPLLGMAIGGATGAATGAMTDVGVDDKFMKELGDKLQPGNAAVFVLVRRSTRTRSCRGSPSTAARSSTARSASTPRRRCRRRCASRRPPSETPWASGGLVAALRLDRARR